jgi:hypothetical protein
MKTTTEPASKPGGDGGGGMEVGAGDLGPFDPTSVMTFLGSWASANVQVITTVKISLIFGGNSGGVLKWLSFNVETTTTIASLSWRKNQRKIE